MIRKILLSVMVVVLALTSCAFAGVPASQGDVKIGVLSKLNMTKEDYKLLVDSARSSGKFKTFSLGGAGRGEVTFAFYDSLNTLQMALNKGEIDEIALPEPVAEYMLNTNSDYELAAITRRDPTYISFGFRKSDDPKLKNNFNDALLSMKADGTLAIIVSKFITEPETDEPEPISFLKYDNADTVKVAVTGDLPPIDYVAADGKAEGFNIAILAEISKRLHINIELVNIDSAARAASLASGRSDVVFWFESSKRDVQADVPEGVILSESYFSWDELFHIKKK
ncbi:MAG: transporter substrate-binding domain-containing protein [Synergistaceae bacterium]|nr:transporter substrate-binding domain-containing protein [Synergistaceae bacterium]